MKKVQGLVWLCESCESPAKEALSMSSPKLDEVRKLRESVDEQKKNFVSLNEIKRELTEIKSLVNSSSSGVNIKVELSKHKPHPPEPPAVTPKLLENSVFDRSILVFGINEHEPSKLKSSERLEKDLSTAKNFIQKVHPSI